MNKILLEVYVPTIEKKYEVFVPISKTIQKVTILLNKSINELTDGSFPINTNIRIYNQQNGELIDPNMVLKDSGLVNGSKILLI